MPDRNTIYPGFQGSPLPDDVRAVTDSRFIPPVENRDQAQGFVRVVNLPAPDISPPVGSVDVIQRGQFQTTVAGETGTLASFVIPEGMILLLRSVDLAIDDMVQATDVTFAVQVNQGSYPGYGALKIFPGAAARVTKTYDQSVLRFRGPDTVRIVFTNTDGGNHLVGGEFSGYMMATNIYKQYGGQDF